MTPAEAAREIALDLGLAGTPEQDRISFAFERFADLLEKDQIADDEKFAELRRPVQESGRPCSYCDGTGIVPGCEGQVWTKGRGWYDPGTTP